MVFDSVEAERKRPRLGRAEQDPGQRWPTLMRASKGGVAPEVPLKMKGIDRRYYSTTT